MYLYKVRYVYICIFEHVQIKKMRTRICIMQFSDLRMSVVEDRNIGRSLVVMHYDPFLDKLKAD